VVHCGVDEAGKGAVLGPLVVAAVGCRETEDLAGLGVRDSKALTPAQREALAERIRDSFPTAILSLTPADVDSRGMSMNVLMARSHAHVISLLAPPVAIVDACDVNPARYGSMVLGFLTVPCRVIAEHHADQHHPAVSAASIIAKVERDHSIARMREEWGDIGSGYPSDPATVRFLVSYFREHGHCPPIARRSWATVRELAARHEQQDLTSFLQ